MLIIICVPLFLRCYFKNELGCRGNSLHHIPTGYLSICWGLSSKIAGPKIEESDRDGMESDVNGMN